MTIFIILLIIIAAVLVIPLLLALFIKNEYSIRKEIVINKPTGTVFNYIKYLVNQEKFSKWVMMDPKMKKALKGTDGTVGFVYAWDSEVKQAGKGEQEIISLIEDKLVDVEVRFEKPMKGVAKTPIALESISSNQTKVIWGMDGYSKYLLNIMNPFMDKLLGKDLQESLDNLKRIIEK